MKRVGARVYKQPASTLSIVIYFINRKNTRQKEVHTMFVTHHQILPTHHRCIAAIEQKKKQKKFGNSLRRCFFLIYETFLSVVSKNEATSSI